MKSGFTMIELIFVIVIIGVLTAVAIPKLAATRTDAMISVKAQNIMAGATDVAAYAMANGNTESKLSDMAQGFKALVNSGDATEEDHIIKIKSGSVDDCIVFQIINPDTNTETLKLSYGNTTDDTCNRLRSLIDEQQFPMKLHGTAVLY